MLIGGVESIDNRWNIAGESNFLIFYDGEVWRYRDQTGVDILVVYTANDEYYSYQKLILWNLTIYENIPPGDYDRKIKT